MTSEVPTASIFNTHLRDNLNYLKGGSIASVLTTETTTSGTYADLTTVGPSVTVTTDVQALVLLYCRLSNTTAGSFSFMGFALNGTLPADDSQAIGTALGSNGIGVGAAFLITGLTAGSNTFLAKFRVTGNTGTFLNRRLTVIPA